MAQLPITSSQSQTTTQSPQTGAQSVSGTAQSSSVQPGTTSALLNSGSGSIALHPTPLTAVNLSGTQTSTAPADKTAPASHHHANPVLMGFSIGLFVVAVLLFWLAGRSAKNNVI